MRTVTTHAPVGRRGEAFRGKVVACVSCGVASPAMEARSTPVAVRIQRPSATVDAFLKTDRRLFGRKTIALPGAPSKPVGAILRFEIVLADGAPVVRGEGRVISSGPLDGDGEQGLLLGLTKLDPGSKMLFDRIARERAGETVETEGANREDDSEHAEDADGATLPPAAEEPPIPVEPEEALLSNDTGETNDEIAADVGPTRPPKDAAAPRRDAALERLRARKRAS
jgi:molecular chaperone DnaK